MTQFHSDAAKNAAPADAFVAAYIMALYWTETGDGDQPDSEIVMAAEAIESAQHDCDEFRKAAGDLLTEAYGRVGYDESRAGNDFLLTRNGHGAGFWGRRELEAGDLGDRLTVFASQFGTTSAYAGDDGLLYVA